MFNIKQVPEDFIVEEITKHNLVDKGKYLICLMEKKNYTTEDAIQTICRILNTSRKIAGYAGIKDRNAITKQYISLERIKRERTERLKMNDIKLKPLGYSDEPISLGNLEGNRFEIIVRNLNPGFKPQIKNLIPNYFGTQRFSGYNVNIGQALVFRDFKKAAELISIHEGKYGVFVSEYLQSHPTDFLNAIRKVPKKIVMLYVHAYQSNLWNRSVKRYLSLGEEIAEDSIMPVLGFATEITDSVIKGIVHDIMKSENLTFRDFIIREMPEFSFEGNDRRIFMELRDLEILKPENDELNNGMMKQKVCFLLGKGSYATMVIEEMFT